MSKRIVVQPPTKREDGSLLAEKKIYRVAAYARVSTDHDDQLNSLETQTTFFNEYISSNQNWELVKVYADEGISGLSRKNRVQFNQMVEDAKAGKIDIILSKSISRFARNVIDTLTVTRELRACNVYVYFQKENINTKDPNGDFMLNFMAGFAEEESKSISKNIKWAKKRLNKEGKVAVPYTYFLGYKKGDKKFEMVIDENQAPIVKLIYKLYLSGYSYQGIKKFLDGKGIKPLKGPFWNVSTIKSILTNEKYIGDAILQKTFIEDIFTKKVKKNDGILDKVYVYEDHEAIIRRSTFNEVQELKKLRETNCFKVRLFSFKLHCSECHHNYQVRYLQHPETYDKPLTQWICSQKFTDLRCKNIVLNDDELYFALNQVKILLIDEYSFVFNILKMEVKKIIKDSARKEKINKALETIELSEDEEMNDYFWKIIIKRIEVNKNRTLNFILIDGNTLLYKMPQWSVKQKRPYTLIRPVDNKK